MRRHLPIVLAVVVAMMLAVSACGSGQLTSEAAQSLLDEQLGAGAVEVVGMRATGDNEAVARVKLLGGSTDIEVNVTFALFDSGWRSEDAEMAGRIFPVAQLIEAVERGRQRRTMASMRVIAIANGTLRVDTGNYIAKLEGLLVAGTLDVVPQMDGWGNAWVYVHSNGSDTYSITSLGSDGARGPAPPRVWTNEPYDPDIVLRDGQFVQAPTGR